MWGFLFIVRPFGCFLRVVSLADRIGNSLQRQIIQNNISTMLHFKFKIQIIRWIFRKSILDFNCGI